jgi:amidase
MQCRPRLEPTKYGLALFAERRCALEGELSDIRFAAKDVFDLAGLVTRAGNPDWERTHERSTTNAYAVDRLLEAGACLVGRTVGDELAFSLTGENAHFGTPLNTGAPGRMPGGSSSGAAAAVAGGLITVGLGTDTSGSIRVPGSYCGLFGIRPTHGLIPMSGVVPLAPSFDTVGWLAKDSVTLARVGASLLPAAIGVQFKRLLIASDAFANVNVGVSNALAGAVSRTAKALEMADHSILSSEGLERWADVYSIAQGAEVWATHGPWFRTVTPNVASNIRARIEWCSTITYSQIDEARSTRALIRDQIERLLGVDTLLCLPSAPTIAPLRGSADPEIRKHVLTLTCIAGLCGLPQVTIPAADLDGCPLGLSLIAPRGRDRELLAFVATVWPPQASA